MEKTMELMGTAAPTLFGKPIEVPFLNGKFVTITVTEPVENPVYANEGTDAQQLLGNDLKSFAVLTLEGERFGNFTVIENLIARENYKIGNVWVGVPKEGGVPKFKHYRMDEMKVAVRIAYMVARGPHDAMIKYCSEDRFGQTCNSCSRCKRPFQGNQDLGCWIDMREDIDTHEIQLSEPEVIPFKGKYYQAYSLNINDYHVQDADTPPWFKHCDSLDDAFSTICLGLKNDIGLKNERGLKNPFVDYYPFFNESMLVDEESPDSELDKEKVLRLLAVHDKKHKLDGIFIKLLFGLMLSREDYERFPDTISSFMAHCVPEDKGFRMDYISNNLIEAYDLDSHCPYGTNDFHHNGYLTHAVQMALDIRHVMLVKYELQLRTDPVIAVASKKELKALKGYLICNADQPLFAPQGLDDPDMCAEDYILKYVGQLRERFPEIKAALVEILKHDKIVIVDDDEDRAIQDSVGFDIIDGLPIVERLADVYDRHVFAWMLGKLSKRHTIVTCS